MDLSLGVWDRTGDDEISKNYFVLMISFWTVVGLVVTGVTAFLSQGIVVEGTNILVLTLVVLVSSIIGAVIAQGSENPVVSLLGYALIAVPFGVLLGPFVASFEEASVLRVLFVTAMMVLVLGTIGTVIPESLESWGIILLGALTILLVGQFAIPIAGLFGLPIKGALTVWDWVGVAVFSLYVIYDMNRAMRVPRTVDNAIDCAISIYLDFLNIFIRLLSATGTRKSSSR